MIVYHIFTRLSNFFVEKVIFFMDGREKNLVNPIILSNLDSDNLDERPCGEPFLARSAGACPPRSFACPRDRSSGSPDPERVRRAAASPTVARGPVPRDRPIRAKIVHRPRPFLVRIEARRGPGPRPTVNGDGLAYRSAGACPPRSFTGPVTVVRDPDPERAGSGDPALHR